MSFISYAHHQEDVLLWRAFQAVQQGFFIDIGTDGALDGSATQALYARGWRGINIPLDAAGFEMLQALRPDDTNLCLAIPSITLNAVCAKYVQCPIQLLRIGIGYSVSTVLAGFDLGTYRPMIILVSIADDHDGSVPAWETLFTSQRYEFVCFDGQNRFYVAQEHRDLASTLATPPNGRDTFVRYADYHQQQQISRLQAKLEAQQAQLREVTAKPLSESEREIIRLYQEASVSQRRIQELEQRLEHMTSQHDAIRHEKEALFTEKTQITDELQAVYNGTIWRLTKPLRVTLDVVKPVLRKLKEGGSAWIRFTPESRPRRTLRKLFPQGKRLLQAGLRWFKGLLMQHPTTRQYVAQTLEGNPILRRYLRRLAGLGAMAQANANSPLPNVSRETERVYRKLQAHKTR